MSESYPEEPTLLGQSKVKLVRNAKGDSQWEITVVEGADPDELDRLRTIALAQHELLSERFPT